MSKTTALTLCAVLFAATGLWTHLAQSQPQAQRPPLTVEKVTANLYVIFGNGGNVAVMPTPEGVLLVDDKFAQDAPEIVAKVKAISDRPIRYVLNTHQHGDHTGGNQAMLASNAEVIAHKNARANMVTHSQPGLPPVTFSDEAQVFLGGKEVRAHYLGRGHTNGDAVIYFPSERVIHTGDLFVNGSAPFIDYSSGASLIEWDKTIERALQFDVDKVIPGHGPVATKSDLVKWRQSLATLRSRAAQACASGPDGAQQLRQEVEKLGMHPDSLFERSYPGMCHELKP